MSTGTTNAGRMSIRKRSDREYAAHLQGTLDLLILRTLILGPQHGQGIARLIQRESDVLIVNHGSLYPALQRLDADSSTPSGASPTTIARRGSTRSRGKDDGSSCGKKASGDASLPPSCGCSVQLRAPDGRVVYPLGSAGVNGQFCA